ncbi:MAG: ADP-ribosylation factor-like protein [Candidatus Helarchaeota archaeon]
MTQDKTINGFGLKVLIAGLDNSGKTSILYALKHKFLEIARVKPTKKIEISNFNILGLPVFVWDMGGQKKYRKEYFQHKEQFNGTDVLFYVVDIQDPAKFDSSLQYFEDVLGIFELLQADPHIFVLLHKADPDELEKSEVLKNKRMLKKRFMDLPTGFQFEIYETSIFNMYLLNNIFMQGITQSIHKGREIQNLLETFMENIEASAVSVIDKNLLTLFEASTDKTSKQLCHVFGSQFALIAEQLRELNLEIPNWIQVKSEGYLFFNHIPYGDTGFYLIFHTKTKESWPRLKEHTPTFTNALAEAMQYIV